jgi:hypothetical protein
MRPHRQLPLYTALFLSVAGCFAEPDYERWRSEQRPRRAATRQVQPVQDDYNSRRAVHVHNNNNTIPIEERVLNGLTRLRRRLTNYKYQGTRAEGIQLMVAQTVHDLMRYEVTFSEQVLSTQEYNDLLGRIRVIETMLEHEPRAGSMQWDSWGERFTNRLDQLHMFTHGPWN